MLLGLTENSDGSDWALAANSALPSMLKFEGRCRGLNHQASHSSRHESQPTANRPPHIEDWTPLVPATVTRAYIS